MRTAIVRFFARIALILVGTTFPFASPVWAQPPGGIDVAVVNTVAEPVPVQVVDSRESFTVAPRQLTLVVAGAPVAPDPSGTRYAITSLTGVNPSAQPVTLVTRAIAVGGVGADGCSFVFNEEDATDGPEIRIPPNDTVHITFPQPFVTAAVFGTNICLVAGGDGFADVKWSATGYKLLP